MNLEDLFYRDISRQLKYFGECSPVHKKLRKKKYNSKIYHYNVENDEHIGISEEEYLQMKFENAESDNNERQAEILSEIKHCLDKNLPELKKLKNERLKNYQNNIDTEKNTIDNSEDWYMADEKNDSRIFNTMKGDKVRSKSEVIAANTLFAHKIPYDYEPDMFGGKLRPDFVIPINVVGKTIIWEHFGKMDDPEYVYKVLRKLEFYKDHGYEINDNLIVSFEFGKASDKRYIVFGSSEAEKTVREYLSYS